jgi:hypothetical protein
MNAIRLVAVLAALASGAAFAQSGSEPRGSTPPGTSRDGAAPSDGAIKGGTILPGEQGGMPTSKVPSRCEELEGTLRADCLKEEAKAGAGAGGSAPPREIQPSPPDVAPPQNPRPLGAG